MWTDFEYSILITVSNQVNIISSRQNERHTRNAIIPPVLFTHRVFTMTVLSASKLFTAAKGPPILTVVHPTPEAEGAVLQSHFQFLKHKAHIIIANDSFIAQMMTKKITVVESPTQ